MAEMIALHRVAESAKPEGERICYDPYAVHFVGPEVLAFAAAYDDADIRQCLRARAIKSTYRSIPGIVNLLRREERKLVSPPKNITFRICQPVK